MPFYTSQQLKKEAEYIVSDYGQVRSRELEYIKDHEYMQRAIEALDILKNQSFNELIQPLASYFPKTYQYLSSMDIEYQVFFEWWGRFDVKDNLKSQPFFALHQRIYYLSPYDSFCRALPNYLLQGWSKYLGGVVCSDNGSKMWGKTLIDNPFCWQSFDDYLPRRNKKQLIKSLIERIPYVYVDTKEEDPTKQEKHRLKGFPNLRCMLDAREPMSQSKKYDLLLMCYEYNQTVYWVKDGDFERGIFEIEHVEDALDHYFLHVFSQHDQEFSRFDFSPWAGRHVLSKKVTIRQEIELDEDEDDEEVMSIPVSDPELAAKLGHVPNQLRLGFCYSLGIEGFDKDIKRGHDWFWQAIKSGSLLAQYNWASFWCEHADYIRDEASFTLQTLEHMHQQGNLAATYMLGVCYEQGSLGLQLNPQFAVQYYQQAADQGFAPAMNNLADKYETGVGVAQDLNKAFELYNIAAEQEIAAAQWSLAVMYLNGTPIARDDAQGKYYLEKALSNGWDNAQVILDTLD
ncbi:tetratricopeptide repeat protein [Acinetobacter rudis]|uniref:tetratricopeptide repeat protein n=1 Tax=Acinetobacter rudis TaxID=632955 RepID=UPI003340186B